jgi:hypothetical protein
MDAFRVVRYKQTTPVALGEASATSLDGKTETGGLKHPGREQVKLLNVINRN